MHIAYLALGTNIGSKKNTLNKAVKQLGDYSSLIVISPVYETKPWGYKDQENFFNMAVLVKTEYSPMDLLDLIKNLEENLGRKKRFINGPREIDIDIIFYDNLVFNELDLVIPHPRFSKRDFVLKPLIDINPSVIDPLTGKTVLDLYNILPDDLKTIIKQV